MISIFLLLACAKPASLPAPIPAPPADPMPVSATAAQTPSLEEAAVTLLALDPGSPVARADAEISGMAWWGDRLVLLPQYPDFDGERVAVYTAARADVAAAIDGASLPLAPLPFSATAGDGLGWFVENLDCFEGFEAIAFDGDDAWLTVETCDGGGILRGTVSEAGLAVDPTTLQMIPSNSGIDNRGEEALILDGEVVLTMHESNGSSVVTAATAHAFTRALAPTGELPFPAVEYRITDATDVDDAGRFWAINYFYPGRGRQRAKDLQAVTWGVGESHQRSPQVERLLELQLSETAITLVSHAPVYLALDGEEGRNWEGIVRVEGGWLLVTDKHPETLLAFVPGG